MDSPRKISKNVLHKAGPSIMHQSTTIVDLHENIVHHIASLLSFKDMVRMAASFKPWRYLCYTCQNLTLDVDKQCGYKLQNLKRFISFMERLLVFPRNSQLECFTLITHSVPDHHIANWIKYALKYNVKELDLDIRLQALDLPVEVFSLESLKVLRLNMNFRYLKLPSCMQLINLRSLTLVYVKFPDDPFSGLTLEQCVSLETLTLSRCGGFTTLNITSFSLKTLLISDLKKSQLCHLSILCQTLTTLYLNLNNSYNAQNSFKLFAPCLENFLLSFRDVIDCRWNPLKSLQLATVCVSTYSDWNVVFPLGSQLLAMLTIAEEVSLCGVLMQVLAWMMKGRPSFTLNNIKYMKLHTCLSDDETLLIIYLLRRFPNLEGLFIGQETHHYSNIPLHDEVYEEDGDIRNAEFVNHLKGVKMSLLDSVDNNLELAKCLLNNVKVLKKLIVLHKPSDTEKAEKFCRKLDDIHKASLDVEIDMEACNDKFGL